MPKGWTAITVREGPHDRLANFLKKLNQGRQYQKERVSLGDFATRAIEESSKESRLGNRN